MPENLSPPVKLALVIFGLVITSLGIDRVMPPPEYFREKLLYFKEHKDEFDLVFFGASDMHWGISPVVFDEQVSIHGVPMRSFNLAVMASPGYEVDHMIRWALATEPERLKYAVISWRPWPLDAGDETHERQIWWHTFSETVLLLQGLALEDAAALEKFARARPHVTQALRKFTHLGMGPGLLRHVAGLDGGSGDEDSELASRRGFQPLTEVTAAEIWSEGLKSRKKFLEDTDAYLELTEAMAAGGERDREKSRAGAGADAYLELVLPRLVYSTQVQMELLERHGVYPIHILPPNNAQASIPRRLESEGYIPLLLPFDDPREYPDLFELPNRFDQSHLNDVGAERYSRHLADRLAPLFKSGLPKADRWHPTDH